MKVHRYHTSQILPIPVQDAWVFFSDPNNLEKLTPPDMGFRNLSELNEPMFRGQIVMHRLKLAPLIWINWVSEITELEKESYFVDQQVSGPYRFWHHLHRFSQHDNGTEISDTVHYSLPLSPLGNIVAIPVRQKVAKIFKYRQAQCAKQFN